MTRKRFLPFFCACAVAVMTFVCLTGKAGPSKYPTLLCFQAEDAGNGEIAGFVFQYERSTPQRFSLLLRSVETGKTTAIALEGGLERNDVNDYFACGYDYRLSGFRARAAVEEECEFIVQFSPFLQVPTGVYLSPASGIHYAPEASFRAPDTGGSEALERIVNNGVLRLYRPPGALLDLSVRRRAVLDRRGGLPV